MKKLLSLLLLVSLVLTGCAGGSGGDYPADGNPGTNQGNLNQENGGNGENQNDQNDSKDETDRTYEMPEMKGEITISLLDSMPLLEAGAQMFMDKYPDVTINIHTFRSLEAIQMEGGMEMAAAPSAEQSSENYLSQLNTRLMSGNAEDIILISRMPLQKYISMGVFEELSFYMENSPEINKENYFMNLFEAAGYGSDRMYSLPLATGIQTITFANDLVTDSNLYLPQDMKNISYEEALKYALQLVENTNRNNTFLGMADGQEVVMEYVKLNWDHYVNEETKEVNFDSDEYVQLLKMAADLEAKGYYDTSGLDFYNMEYYFAMHNDFDVQAAYYSLLPGSSDYHTMPFSDGKGNVPMNAYMQFGINSASANKELAWEFLKFMISDEVQQLPSLYNLSVNRKGFDAYLDRQITFYNEGNAAKIDQDAYKDLLKGWMEQINVDYTERQMIVNMLYLENLDFFDGKISAEDAAARVQEKVNKYFNE